MNSPYCPMKPNQVSKTAAFVAIKFYGLTRDEPYRSWFDPAVLRFYQRLVRALPAPLNWYENLLKQEGFRRLFAFLEERLLPGDLMHILLRKYYIGRWLDHYRKQGYRQLVVPGGGFDHQSTLQARNGLRAVELDAPGMAGMKHSFIESNGYSHPRLTVVPAFFSRDSLLHRLNTIDELDPDDPALVVTEGFFDYLTPRNASEILEDLRHFFNGRIRLITTLFALDELSPFYRFVFRSGVRMVGERIRSDFTKQTFQRWLENHRYEITEMVDRQRMTREILHPHFLSYPVMKGFYLFSALSER